jgi:hypothetical protein
VGAFGAVRPGEVHMMQDPQKSFANSPSPANWAQQQACQLPFCQVPVKISSDFSRNEIFYTEFTQVIILDFKLEKM